MNTWAKKERANKPMKSKLREIVEEIERLEKAHDILERVWIAVGPYNHDKIDNELMRDLNNYMEFDDSA